MGYDLTDLHLSLTQGNDMDDKLSTNKKHHLSLAVRFGLTLAMPVVCPSSSLVVAFVHSGRFHCSFMFIFSCLTDAMHLTCTRTKGGCMEHGGCDLQREAVKGA